MGQGLVVGRALGESVLITVGDEKITVTVTMLKRSKCRLQVKCSPSVKIDRLECLTQGVGYGRGKEAQEDSDSSGGEGNR